MSRKGENIYKRKDGRWEGRYLKRSPDGKSRYGYVYASTYRDVKARLQKAAALWETTSVKERDDSLRLKAVAQRWEANIAQQIKESSFAKYHSVVTKHLLPALGEVCVEDMTHELIESFSISLLRGEGKNAKPLIRVGCFVRTAEHSSVRPAGGGHHSLRRKLRADPAASRGDPRPDPAGAGTALPAPVS